MTDRSRYPDSKPDTGAGRDRESTIDVLRWLKVAAIIVAVVVLLIVVMMLIGGGGGGEHGPGRHALTGGDTGDTRSPSVTEGLPLRREGHG